MSDRALDQAGRTPHTSSTSVAAAAAAATTLSSSTSSSSGRAVNTPHRLHNATSTCFSIRLGQGIDRTDSAEAYWVIRLGTLLTFLANVFVRFFPSRKASPIISFLSQSLIWVLFKLPSSRIIFPVLFSKLQYFRYRCHLLRALTPTQSDTVGHRYDTGSITNNVAKTSQKPKPPILITILTHLSKKFNLICLSARLFALTVLFPCGQKCKKPFLYLGFLQSKYCAHASYFLQLVVVPVTQHFFLNSFFQRQDMGNEGSAPSTGESTPVSEYPSMYSIHSRVRSSVESTRAASPMEPPAPDMSHLTEEEIAQIKQVMDRAKNLQEEETTRTRKGWLLYLLSSDHMCMPVCSENDADCMTVPDALGRDIKYWGFKYWNINYWDIKYWNIKYWDIKYWDIKYWNIKYWDIKYWNF
ncbi:tripartite motif-containing protein 45 [Elysia marginata]|uniref:Tripartite motif-containing protein 45 n=1 Tax=Elysia marginata TaxID=1093978 RepID=A0AAV4HGT0_9GAST|nr:tripartite motif-containing protein 45 [Elysia marginata]